MLPRCTHAAYRQMRCQRTGQDDLARQQRLMTLNPSRRCQGSLTARASNCCAVSCSAGTTDAAVAPRSGQTNWLACSRRVAPHTPKPSCTRSVMRVARGLAKSWPWCALAWPTVLMTTWSKRSAPERMSCGWVHSHNVSMRIADHPQAAAMVSAGARSTLQLQARATTLDLDAHVGPRCRDVGQAVFVLGQLDRGALQGLHARRLCWHRCAHALEVLPREPPAHDVRVQAVGDGHGRHGRAGLPALGKHLCLPIGPVNATLGGIAIRRCPPNLGGHHHQDVISPMQDGTLRRSRRGSPLGVSVPGFRSAGTRHGCAHRQSQFQETQHGESEAQRQTRR